MMMRGYAEEGLRKGAYYVRQFSDKFKEKCGFSPFPGTLNLRLKSKRDVRARREMGSRSHILIEPFERGGKSFVQVKCYPCTINGKTRGMVVFPGKTYHPPEVIEVVAEVNLRESLGIRDGDPVAVELV